MPRFAGHCPANRGKVIVYSDEISAYTAAEARSLTPGDPVTLTDLNGTTLATPVRLNDYAFKTVYE